MLLYGYGLTLQSDIVDKSKLFAVDKSQLSAMDKSQLSACGP
jgi:hypothetical protein